MTEYLQSLPDGWTIYVWMIAAAAILIGAAFFLRWAVKNFQFDEDIKYVIFDERDKDKMDPEEYEKSIKPILQNLRKAILHGDANEHNFIVLPGQPTKISGLIDFGEIQYGTQINDLAITLARSASDIAPRRDDGGRISVRSTIEGTPFLIKVETTASPTPTSRIASTVLKAGFGRKVSAAARKAFWSRGVNARKAC